MKYRIKEVAIDKKSYYYPQQRCFLLWRDIVDMSKDGVYFQTMEEATAWINRKIEKNKPKKSIIRYYPYEPER